LDDDREASGSDMTGTTYRNPFLIEPHRGLPERMAVIGAGTIGPDIAYYLKSEIPGLELILVDIDQSALERAVMRIGANAQKGVDRGKLTDKQAARVKERIIATTDYDAIADCDWVLEAATENLTLKRKIFSQVEAVVRPDALITSNTSSLPAHELFTHLKHPERATVTHFFAPAFQNPAVEVIDWERLDRRWLDYLRWAFCSTGKLPLTTRDVVCFMLDRIFDNWCNEAGLLLDGATPAEVDSVAAEFVHAGPFFVLNLANGNPIIIEANSLQAQVEGQHYRPAAVFESAGKWETVRPGDTIAVTPAKAASIRDRLLGILFSQSVDILDRDIGDASDLDLGCRIALGFKKGPLELMRQLGEEEVSRKLGLFAATRRGMPMPKMPIRKYAEFNRYVLLDEVGDVKVITLRRPDALNALHDEMTDEILALLRCYQDDSGTAGFVITGYGTRAFCAGADIGRFPELLGDRGQAVEYARRCSRLLVYLDHSRKPVVAAVNGIALGGGLELAMRCHGIVAIDGTWMQFPEIKLGIVPGIGGMVVPYRRWPGAQSLIHGMLARADRLSARNAHAAGIVDALSTDFRDLVTAAVNRVHVLGGTDYRIDDQAVEIAEMAIAPPLAADGQTLSTEVLAIMKSAVSRAGRADSLEAALEIGYCAFGDSACTAAANEGITAFTERRIPDFGKTG
jgi:enoyl-CoA hydratase/3-hydroxyacyl-CoA dehydrogenase